MSEKDHLAWVVLSLYRVNPSGLLFYVGFFLVFKTVGGDFARFGSLPVLVGIPVRCVLSRRCVLCS